MVSLKDAGPLFLMTIQMQHHLEREPQQEDAVNHLELEKAFVRHDLFNLFESVQCTFNEKENIRTKLISFQTNCPIIELTQVTKLSLDGRK